MERKESVEVSAEI